MNKASFSARYAAAMTECGGRCPIEAGVLTAGPAQGFYERVGFHRVGTAQTRFGPAMRMRLELHR